MQGKTVSKNHTVNYQTKMFGSFFLISWQRDDTFTGKIMYKNAANHIVSVATQSPNLTSHAMCMEYMINETEFIHD